MDAAFFRGDIADPRYAPLNAGNGVTIVGQPTPMYSISGYPLPPEPIGRWRDGLCDWSQECGSCLCAWCCPVIVAGQLYEKILKKGGCVVFVGLRLAIPVVLLIILQICASIANNNLTYDDDTTTINGQEYTVTTAHMPGWDARSSLPLSPAHSQTLGTAAD